MDIEKLIEQMKKVSDGLVEGDFPKCANAVRNAAAALSTLQAENEKLRKELEWKDMVIKLAQRKQRESEAALRREQDG